MLKLKLGLLIGFAAGWAVGSGKAAELWAELQGKPAPRAATGPQRESSVGDVTSRLSQEAAAGS